MKSTTANWRYLIHCVRIESRGGDVIRLVDYPVDLTISGSTYRSDHGYQFSGLETRADNSPPVIDLEGILTSSGLSRQEIREDKWRNAFCYVFATSWDAPVEDEEPIAKGLLGRIQLINERYKAEIIHIIDLLNQPIGAMEVPVCRWTLFDETLDGRQLPYQKSRCTLNLADHKVTGTVTSVTDRFTFADSGRTEADDWFSNGEVKFTSGANAGLAAIKIKVSEGGSFVLHDAAKHPIQVGDTYEMAPGCRGRFHEDCVAKWANGENFSSSVTVPTGDVIAKIGTGL